MMSHLVVEKVYMPLHQFNLGPHKYTYDVQCTYTYVRAVSVKL